MNAPISSCPFADLFSHCPPYLGYIFFPYPTNTHFSSPILVLFLAQSFSGTYTYASLSLSLTLSLSLSPPPLTHTQTYTTITPGPSWEDSACIAVPGSGSVGAGSPPWRGWGLGHLLPLSLICLGEGGLSARTGVLGRGMQEGLAPHCREDGAVCWFLWVSSWRPHACTDGASQLCSLEPRWATPHLLSAHCGPH